MNVKSDKERKTKVLKIRLNDREYAKLKQYTEESGLRSMSEYIFNSIIATPIIELTDEELAPEKARLKKDFRPHKFYRHSGQSDGEYLSRRYAGNTSGS